jgi:methylamine utilization protein MauE
VADGVALALAVLLAGAGGPKLWRPGYVAGALRRVFGRGRDLRTPVLRVFGRLLGAWEIALAAAMVFPGGRVVAVSVALTFVGFTGFVAVAIRRGASCGCWASLSEGPAGGAELARTVTLTLAATWLATVPWQVTFDLPTLGWAAASLAATWLATVLGGRVAPIRSPKVTRRLAMQSAPTLRGRTLAKLAFLAGFVHTGTNAEHDRLVRALTEAQRGPRLQRPTPPGPPARSPRPTAPPPLVRTPPPERAPATQTT